MTACHLPTAILAPALTLLVAAGLAARAPHRDVATLADAPVAGETVEAAWGSLREKPVAAQVVTVESSLPDRTTQERDASRLRSGCRPACRAGAVDADVLQTCHPGEPADASALDGVNASRRAAFAGRRSAPPTAPPSRPL